MGRYRVDTVEIQGRSRGDLGEIWADHLRGGVHVTERLHVDLRGDMGEIEGR